ncbi:MAG TPA: adenylyltransferase/cytidyltransferase family protein [Patescibacteria group bacterium]
MNISSAIVQLAKATHHQGQKLVLVTGVFDLLHQEHVHFLKRAKAAGDVLLVGIESDVRVKQLKGEGRPIENQALRKQKVATVPGVDGAFILPEVFDQPEHHLELLKILRPDILAVSSHTPHLEEKRQLMSVIGGRVEVVLEQNPAVSTTQIIKTGA